MFSQGLSSNEVAARMGLDGSTVRAWVRKSRKYGREALQPYWRASGCLFPRKKETLADAQEGRFLSACLAYASATASAASIARRHGLDYHSFLYKVRRYYPELVEARRMLKKKGSTNK